MCSRLSEAPEIEQDLEAGQSRSRGKQDKRARHVCARKALSAHGLSRHALSRVRAVKIRSARCAWIFRVPCSPTYAALG